MTPEQISSEIETAIVKLNHLATQLPIEYHVTFSVGEIGNTHQYPNGYITATIYKLEIQ